jgi:hypothetical protein
VTRVKVGPLVIKGIVGRVNLRQDSRGRMVRNDFGGSSIGEILVDGKSQGGFTPGEASQIPVDGIPGVVKIELFKREKHTRSASISAVVITFADGTPGVSVLRLGNARASMTRY